MEKIKLDLIPSGKMPSLHASQYDDGREHGIDLFENGVAYKLDGTETLTINERKGDDCVCSLDIENTFTGSNHIVFASTEQMCAVWGNNICELVIAKGEKTIGTLNFILEVEPSPTEGGIESESEIKNLERQIEEITEEVIGEDYYTKTQTNEAIATAIEGKADTTYVNTELDKKADKNNTYTKTEVDEKIDELPEPMIFKGTLGVGGTIQTLPTASASNEGFTYKVITDGTYAGQTAKVGDVFTSNGSEWVYIPSGDEDNDTWRAIKVNGTEELGSGISSGSVDFVGSENIDVEFDANGNKVGVKTKNIYTKNEVDDIVYNILPDDTASGSVANFNTSLELPIKSLEVDVNAVQEAGTPTPTTPLPISGWSSINLYQRGFNLFDKTTVVNGEYINDTNGTARNDANSKRTDYIEIVPNTNYYIKSEQTQGTWGAWYDANKNFISGINGYNNIRHSPVNARYVRLTCFRGGSGNIDTFCFNVSDASKNGQYEPYNGNEYIINLGGTYYGGKLDVKTGKFLITYEKANTPSRNATAYGGLSSRGVRFPSALNGSYRFARAVCNMARVVYSTDYVLGCMAVGIDNAQIYWFGIIDLLGLADLDAFKNWLDNNPVEVYYEITTPIEIQLTPTQIKTLVGTNNIFADTGDTEVVFKCSVNDYVSAHSGGNLLGMGGVYLGGAKSGGGEEEPDEGEDTEKVKLDETKEEVKTIGDTKKLGGE